MDYRAYLREAEEKLDDVEHALDRLAEGSYGTCELCASAIDDSELETAPATRWCERHRPAVGSRETAATPPAADRA